MFLKNIIIHNYRSLRKVELKNIGNLAILVGKNSSGKTNLLEALWLFSKDFSLVPEIVTINSPLTANELMWFEGNYDVPIVLHIEIELNDSESKRVFPSDFLKTFKSDNGKTAVKVERQIVATPPNMSWKTIELVCNDVLFIEDGKIATPPRTIEQKETANEHSKTKEVSKKSNEAPIDKKFLSARERERIEASEKEEKTRLKVLESFNLQNVQKMAKGLENEFRGKIMWIQASRCKTSTPSNYGVRTATVDDVTTSKIVGMGENLTTKIRRNWRRLQEDFESFSPFGQRLNIVKSQIIVDETDLSVPLFLVGGGTQEIVARARAQSFLV